MPFRPEPVQPDFEKLRAIINTSAGAFKDKAMWQILITLLDQLKKFQSITVDDIADLTNIIEGINNLIITINGILADSTFLTVADETLNLPNSVRELPGNTIEFQDSANQRIIHSRLPVGTIYSTYVNVNPNALLGYGTWLLFATGVKAPGTDITFTVY